MSLVKRLEQGAGKILIGSSIILSSFFFACGENNSPVQSSKQTTHGSENRRFEITEEEGAKKINISPDVGIIFYKMNQRDDIILYKTLYPVTNRQYEAFYPDSSVPLEEKDSPKVGIRYEGAVYFCRWLNKNIEGFNFRIPELTEWRCPLEEREYSQNEIELAKRSAHAKISEWTSTLADDKDKNTEGELYNSLVKRIVIKIPYGEDANLSEMIRGRKTEVPQTEKGEIGFSIIMEKE